MFIRKTQTRNKSTTEAYFTYRLVTSERVVKQIRQITLINLGRQFDLPQPDWPRLCARIEALLEGQTLALIPEPQTIETLAQRYAARLITARPAQTSAPTPSPSPQTQAPVPAPAPLFAEIDPASIQLTRPRSVGVEAAGMAAIAWLGLDKILQDLGFNPSQRAADVRDYAPCRDNSRFP